MWPRISHHGKEGARRNWGRIGPNKEEQLSQATKPATQQMQLSHQSATNLPPCSPPCSPSAAHVPLFGTPTPLTQPTVRPRSFFSFFFSWFFTCLSLFFFFWFFSFSVSFVSFFTSFGQSIGRFCRFDVTDFVQSEHFKHLVISTLKISDVTKMSNRRYRFCQIDWPFLVNRYFPKESGLPKVSSTFVSFSL